MSRLVQSVVVIFSLLFFMSVQASVGLPARECAIFADEETAETQPDGEEAGDKTKKEGEEEEEPECD